MTKDNKQTKTFHLRCTKCDSIFSIKREIELTPEAISKMECMNCGGKIVKATEKEGKAHANALATQEAFRLAGNQRRIDDEMGLNETISITSNQEGKNKGKTEKISKKVVESIKDKVSGMGFDDNSDLKKVG